MKEVEIGERDTIESIVNNENTSLASVREINQDKNFETLSTGDKLNIPDGPLPDIETQQKQNKVAKDIQPRSIDTEYDYVDLRDNSESKVKEVNPNHQMEPKEIDDRDFTPNSNFMANISVGDLFKGMGSQKVESPVDGAFKSSERALTQMVIDESLGLKDERNKGFYDHSYNMMVPTSGGPEERERLEQMQGEALVGVGKGLLGLPNLALQATQEVTKSLDEEAKDDDTVIGEVVGEGQVSDFMRDAENTTLEILGKSLFGEQWSGSGLIEDATGFNPSEFRDEKLNQLMDMSYDEGNKVLVDRDKRRKMVEDAIDKHIDKTGTMEDGVRQTLVDNTMNKLESKADAIKSDVKWSGVVGEIVGSLPLAFATEMAAFHGISRALPAFQNGAYRVGAKGLSSIGSGVTTDALFRASETDDPDEIINAGIAGGVLNAGIDVMLPAGVATAAKGVKWTKEGFPHAMRYFKRADEYTTDEYFQNAMDSLRKARKAGDDDEVLKHSKDVKKNIEKAELDPALDEISDNITSNFEDVFDNRSDIHRVLEYKYDKNTIRDLNNTELLHFDTYLAKAKRNDEFGSKIKEILDKNREDLKKFDEDHETTNTFADLVEKDKKTIEKEFTESERRLIEKTDEELLEESSWFNTKSMLGEDGVPDNPFLQQVLGQEKKIAEGKIGNASLTDVGKESKLSTLWSDITKRIGPVHKMAVRTEKTSGVPMSLAVRDLEDKVRSAQSEFQEGIGELEGFTEIDRFFSDIGMYGKQNEELQDDVFKFMMDKEYSSDQLTEEAMEASEYIRTEEQKKLVRKARDWFDNMAEHTDLETKELIKNYTPRRIVKNSASGKTQGLKVAEHGQLSDILPEKAGFEQERALGDMSFEEYKKYLDNLSTEDFKLDIDTDLQRIMKNYLWGVSRKRHLDGALEAFQRQIDKLKGQNHADAEFWDNWAKEITQSKSKGSVGGVTMGDYIAEGVDKLNQAFPGGRTQAGEKLRKFMENKDVADFIMSGTYGQYLFADQMFRFMNAGQTALTKARVGEENFARSFFDPANNGRLLKMFDDNTATQQRLDKVLQNMNIRGPSDQFITSAKTEFGQNIVGKEANKGLMTKARNQLLSFENISASDRFNVRNAFYAGVDTIDKYADDYINGSMSWDEFVQNTNIHRTNPVVRSNVKNSLDNGRVGALKVVDGAEGIEAGTNIRVNEYLNMDPDVLKQMEFTTDQKSAEAIFGTDTVYNTQWNYGKGAMGSFFWREGASELGKMTQAATLPFQTWWINMMYQTKDMLIDNPANADQMINLMTTQTAYADAASRVFDENSQRWIGPMSIPSRPFSSPPGQAMLAGLTAANLSVKDKINVKGLNQYQRMKKGEALAALAEYLYGSGTLVGRSQKVIDESLRMLSGGSMSRQDIIDTINAGTGIKFKNNNAKEYANKLQEEFGEF